MHASITIGSKILFALIAGTLSPEMYETLNNISK